MIKLKFIPDFFPIVLLPLYWFFLLCFYLFYIPIFFFIWLFSPYKSKKSLKAFYLRKAKKDQRKLEYKKKKEEEEKKKKEKENEQLDDLKEDKKI